MKPKYKRLLNLISLLGIFLFGCSILFYNLKDNLVFFYSPTEAIEKKITNDKKIRIGGMVKNKSLKKNVTIVNDKKVEKISFIITDLNKEILVSYVGILPDLFREGQGIIAEGKLHSQKSFIAEKVLAKHDENYMPPEIRDIKTLREITK